DTGAAGGSGATINVPLMAGCGDPTFLGATDGVLSPALRRFRPDAILVSVGFDAHWADPLAQMRLSLRGYGEILSRIKRLADELCGGRLILLLEGGYDLQVIDGGAAMAGRILAGATFDADPLGAGPAA